MRFIITLLLFFTNIFAFDIVYEIDEPYIFKRGGKLTGYTYIPAINALKKSNIKYTLKEKPLKVQLKDLQDSNKEFCAIGWSKNTDIQKFTKYTLPIYKDNIYGILTQKKHNIEPNTDIKNIMNERKYKLLVKKGFPYDSKLVKIINKLPKKVVNTLSSSNLVTLIAKKKGDFIFISKKKADIFLKTHKYKSRVKFVPIIGLEQVTQKYLVCSSKVKTNTIETINKHLK